MNLYKGLFRGHITGDEYIEYCWAKDLYEAGNRFVERALFLEDLGWDYCYTDLVEDWQEKLNPHTDTFFRL
jgi:hypothetical protein